MSLQIITLSGLHCEACTKISLKRLGRMEGVQSAIPLEPQGVFEVRADRALNKLDVEQAIQDTEYKVVEIKDKN